MAKLTIVECVRQSINTLLETYGKDKPVSDIDVAQIVDLTKECHPDLIDWDNKNAVYSLRHTVYEERRKFDPDYTPPTSKAKNTTSQPRPQTQADGSLTPDAAMALFASINTLMERFPSGDEFNETVREVAKLLETCGGSVDKLLTWAKIITVKRIQP